MKLRFLFLILALCYMPPVWARQIEWHTSRVGNMVQFTYRYDGYDGSQRQLGFMLNAAQMEQGAQQFSGFSQDEMDKFTMEYLHYYAAQIPGVQVSIDKVGDTLNFHAEGANSQIVKQAVDQLQQRTTEAQDQFLQSRYYVKDTTDRYIMPDHVRIAMEYIPQMRTVARAIQNEAPEKNQRGIIDAALNFIQNIPYDILEDRSTSNGSGFSTPYGMLALNKGDCDTKSVALASIVKVLFPQMPVMIVYTRNHAFIGFATQSQPGDRILTIGRQVFVLAEPAGPGLYPIGKIGHESSADLDRNYFSYVLVQ